MTEQPKRGPGRPRKLPPGCVHKLRCDVTASELDVIRAAAAALGLSQQEFTRKAVLGAAGGALAGGGKVGAAPGSGAKRRES